MTDEDVVEHLADSRKTARELVAAFTGFSSLLNSLLIARGLIEEDELVAMVESIAVSSSLPVEMGGSGGPNPFLMHLARVLRDPGPGRPAFDVIDGGKVDD